MEQLVTIRMHDYELAISNHTAVKMALEYLDECEMNGDRVEISWMRFLLNGCPLEPWQKEILRELDCPEEPRNEKKKSCVGAQDFDEEDLTLS